NQNHPATATATTPVTDVAIKALISRGVADALAEHEIQRNNNLNGDKLEMEIWELKVKGADLASYTQRFQELALMCGMMFPGESDKIEKYVGGLPDMIPGSAIELDT
ncbi:hypothetical protein Tco_0170975, partial [Tanacetum coccineum]